jgi:hypothetical protein
MVVVRALLKYLVLGTSYLYSRVLLFGPRASAIRRALPTHMLTHF